MLAEHKRLEKEISSLQSKLQSFPNGKLICVRNGGHYKWFHSDGHTQTYIPKKKRELAEQLAENKEFYKNVIIWKLKKKEILVSTLTRK